MKYAVKFPSSSVEKKFSKSLNAIPQEAVRKSIKEKVVLLSGNPRPYGEPKLKPPVDIYSFAAQYRLRVGDHRILYDVDDSRKTVWILALRRRNERTY